jgi:hypothetical protein
VAESGGRPVSASVLMAGASADPVDAAGTWIASAGIDGVICVWDPYDDIASALPQQHATSVWTLAVIPGADGMQWLASADVEGGVKLWDPVTGRGRPGPSGHHNAINALAVLPGPGDATWLASADVEGVIRLWDPASGLERTLAGHPSAVYALAVVPGSGDVGWLASADVKGTIKLWEPITGEELTVLADRHDMLWDLAVLPNAGGAGWLASAGVNGKIHLWDVDTLTRTGPELDHLSVVYALAAITGEDGVSRLASAGVDGRIRIWDVETGAEVMRLTGHDGPVRDLAVIPRPGGGSWLASGGGDGVVRIWDIGDRQAVARFEDHWGSVLALSPISLRGIPEIIRTPGASDSLSPRDTRARVVGIRTPGFGDRAAPVDLLGRTDFVETIADVLSASAGETAASDDGPSVISIDGPWGSGKTTIMNLVKARLDTIADTNLAPAAKSPAARFTVRAADRAMRRRAPAPAAASAVRDSTRPVSITAWFNPWAHQSHDQIWAGLAREIISAAQRVLYPDTDSAERYWFQQNLRRLDRRDLKRLLWRRIASPFLGLSVLTLLIPVVAVITQDQFGQKSASVHFLGLAISAGEFALIIPFGVLLCGTIHTFSRYAFGRASSFLPGEIFRGPLLSGGSAGSRRNTWSTVDDPMYNAPSGYLYLLQHDIRELLRDVRESGHELIVFIDDLDRCAPRITADVFEAINLFISESFPRVRFVIGLDPAIVAAHVDYTYEHLKGTNFTSHPGDPSPGWTFLRKLIQLPIAVPRIRERSVDRLLDEKLGVTETVGTDFEELPPIAAAGVAGSVPAEPAHPGPAAAPSSTPGAPGEPVAAPSAHAGPADGSAGAAALELATPASQRQAGRTARPGSGSGPGPSPGNGPSHGNGSSPSPGSGPDPGSGFGPGSGNGARSGSGNNADGQRRSASALTIERHPEVRAQIRARLDAQLDRSARQAKRLLTVWQFYVRLCQRARPLEGDAAASRACALVLVAEILTRWPASVRSLTTTIDGITGLQLLAANVDNDVAWQRALTETGLEVNNRNALGGLRDLLASAHGLAAADLFTMVT